MSLSLPTVTKKTEVDRIIDAGAFVMGRNMFGPIGGEVVAARAASFVTHITYRIPR
jgi:hypothetical protein